MIFTQIEFYFLLAAMFAGVLLVKDFGKQKLILLAGSFYFYAYWDWRFFFLFLACIVINWWLADQMEKTSVESKRKFYVFASVGSSLAVLGFFKYFNFFVDSFKALVGAGVGEGKMLEIVLPVGISFYTFQTLSYTIDVYRRDLPHCKRLTDFALYVAFFPQLVAGPIVRASEFLPQLETPRTLSWARAYDGFRQFALGLFKKVFIADRLAQFVDPAFENSAVLDGPTLWIVILAYAIQIYCDFSGYSDMAIGMARALGFDLSKNFDHPYLATSIQDFWRRWHISLSSWLRDYLYIPLGGNRGGPARTYLNLFLTMLLGGLWHGASWTFVFWGAWHGAALSIDRYFFSGRRGRHSPPASLAVKLTGWLVTLLVVLIGWVFFRSPNFATALTYFGRMFTFEGDGIGWYSPFAIGVILFIAAYHVLLAMGKEAWFDLKPDTILAPAILITLIWLTIAFYPTEFQPFIYFQF
jgi:alginate O-acetyltransferase complex protein AlgI